MPDCIQSATVATMREIEARLSLWQLSGEAQTGSMETIASFRPVLKSAQVERKTISMTSRDRTDIDHAPFHRRALMGPHLEKPSLRNERNHSQSSQKGVRHDERGEAASPRALDQSSSPRRAPHRKTHKCTYWGVWRAAVAVRRIRYPLRRLLVPFAAC